MGDIEVRRVHLRVTPSQTFGSVALTIPGYDEPLILSGFRLRRRAIDDGLTVIAPVTLIGGQQAPALRLPADLFAAIRDAFAAELDR